MAAESARDNMQRLTFSLDSELGHTELYLTHFLGVDQAISFLQTLATQPDAEASGLFPLAAETNRRIFYSEANTPRTVTDVYNLFDRKFSSERYRDGDADSALDLTIQ